MSQHWPEPYRGHGEACLGSSSRYSTNSSPDRVGQEDDSGLKLSIAMAKSSSGEAKYCTWVESHIIQKALEQQSGSDMEVACRAYSNRFLLNTMIELLVLVQEVVTGY